MNAVYEPAFLIQRTVGAVVWSEGAAAGDFVPLRLTQVVTNPKPALELERHVGTDGWFMLWAMASMASQDSGGQLVIVGGVKRLLSEIGWKKDKAYRVFNRLAKHGFVAQSQGKTVGPNGRVVFLESVLVLHPRLYQQHVGVPGMAPLAAPPDAAASTAAPDTTASGATTSGISVSGYGASGETAHEAPGAASAGSHSSGSANPGTGAAAPSTGSGSSGSGITGSGTVPSVDAAHSGSGGSGTAQPGRIHDDVEDDFSSSEMKAMTAATVWNAVPGAIVAGQGAPAGQDEQGSGPSLVAALRAYGFSDADDVVASTPRPVLESSLRYVHARGSKLRSPGGYLRSLIRKGGPADGGGEQLILEVMAQLNPPPVVARTTVPVFVAGRDSDPEWTLQSGKALVDERLATLGADERAKVLAAADAAVSELHPVVRSRAQVVEALRMHTMAKLLGVELPGSAAP